MRAARSRPEKSTTFQLGTKPAAYKVHMKKNKLPVIGKIQDVNDEFNKVFKDEVMMPMVTFAVTLMVFAVLLDLTAQLIDAIEILTTL